MEYNHSANRYRMYVNNTLAVQIDDDLQVRLGKGSFGGMTSGVIAYGNAGSIKKDSILALNATASVSGRGAGISVGGNTERIASFYCQKAGNADSDGGNAFLESKGNLTINVQDSETGIDVNGNGAVELYNDNAKKFETTSYGAKVTDFLNIGNHARTPNKALELYQASNAALRIQNSSTGVGSSDGFLLEQSGLNTLLVNYESGNLDFKTANSTRFLINSSGNVQIPNDSGKLQFGASQDLEIYHNGNHSKIVDTGTGNLYVESDVGNIYLRVSDNEQGVTILQDGAVELYYDNVKKLETFSSGVKIAGDIRVGNASNIAIKNDSGSETLAKFINNGAVELYHNDTKRVETTGNGANVIGNFVADCSVSIDPDSNTNHFITGGIQDGSGWSASGIAFGGTTGHMAAMGSNNQNLYFAYGDGSNANSLTTYSVVTPAGAVELNYNGSRKFQTTSTGGTLTGTLVATGLDVGNSVINRADITVVTDGSRNNGVFLNPGDTGAGNRPNIHIKGAGSAGLSQEAIQVFYNNGSNKTFELDYEGNIEARSLTTTHNISSGSGSDQLNITHSGGGASHVAATGDLVLKGTDNVYIGGVNNETHFKATENGRVELYYDNALRLVTSSTGIQPYGNVRHVDNDKATFGTGNDLEIYHSGSHSIINNNTGDLRIETNRLEFLNHDSDEFYLTADDDGSVTLYYDNSKKYESQEVGANFYGRSVDCQLRLKTSDGNTRGSIYAYQDNSIAFLNSAGSYSFRVNNSKQAHFYGHAYPATNNSYDLGSSSYRWRNIYTQDLQLSNEAVGDNGIDGTWGNYTIVEGESDLFLKNNRSGKTYKFNLTEVS